MDRNFSEPRTPGIRAAKFHQLILQCSKLFLQSSHPTGQPDELSYAAVMMVIHLCSWRAHKTLNLSDMYVAAGRCGLQSNDTLVWFSFGDVLPPTCSSLTVPRRKQAASKEVRTTSDRSSRPSGWCPFSVTALPTVGCFDNPASEGST